VPGKRLWKQAAARLTPAQQQRLRDAVQTRAAWPEFDFAWDDTRDSPRPLSLAGVPRYDAQGHFAGHWALLRDRRAEVQARDALKATETRLHDLFRRVPLPLVLHRGGAVMDANPAAVALFGYRDLHSMLGADMLRTYAEGEDRERAQLRLQEVAEMPLGQTLPAAEYRLRPLSAPAEAGPRIVQVSSAPVELEDGRATLSIYTDETERRQSEQAVQRSEALLSHLVSTSPDAITLTDLANGRYAMVNPSFERITGYRADEVLGRTAGEIAIWADDGDREKLVQAVRDEGSVQNMAATFRDRQGRYVQMLMSAAR
jgi:PAS domain S-box-containing protein